MLIRVVAASAGNDLVEETPFFKRPIVGERRERELAKDEVEEFRSDPMGADAEMLSRAISVTAGALGLRGQDLMYQFFYESTDASALLSKDTPYTSPKTHHVIVIFPIRAVFRRMTGVSTWDWLH